MDLTKRKMLHEGPLTWKVNRDKTIGESSLSADVGLSLCVLAERGRERESISAVSNYDSYCHL